MKLSERIESVNSIAIAGHTRPDGDCVGSCMGLYNYLKENYPTKDVVVYLEDAGNGFAYINRIDEAIDKDDDEKQVDLFILLDTSDLSRIGVANKLFANAKTTICIDHHISNPGLAMENIIVPNASSTAEVLFDLLDEDKISKETAEAIYTGIIHDSGVFKYASTSEHTMNIAGKLMSKGIDFQTIIDDGFYAKTYAQNQILGSALLESVRFFDGKCIFSVVTEREMEFFGVTNKDLGGIVEQMRLTEGVECAIFLYEIEPLTYKVSLRSKKYLDVNKVAGYFGGGGHVRAAGCICKGTTHDVINNLAERIELEFKCTTE
ncbi:MAG: bifunctional oligoribonuclease/PAP phosphatase NrnA [Lachnospiraceae bacterium]|mgnify:CR=1 FL=1|jgi:phosphoesterase RecJ-like protein|nr:bifunctional oligoribonuclease/PAP phosphatase NrnA [Lachnospiraceae bacterium]